MQDGEKAVEVLSHDPPLPSSHPQIRLARSDNPPSVVLNEAVEIPEDLAHYGQRLH